MLSQLMTLFGFFALVLVSVYWVNRAVILFDRLIADGHSAMVFLEFTALSLPNVVRMVMPMAAFAAAVYVTNRLSNDSELTVIQSTGYSPWRLARPVVSFGVILALLMSIPSMFLVPASLAQLKVRETEISGSVSARLLREGVFLHPIDGITFYIRDITEQGELLDIYLSDRRNPDRAMTYTASRAFLLRDEQGPRLVMFQGMAQTYQRENKRLATTDFRDFSYDISSFITTGTAKLKIQHVPTWQLLTNTAEMARLSRVELSRALDELHGRIQQPLLCIVAALIGFSTLLLGGFSRFGLARQIIGAIFLLVVIKMVESAVTGPVRGNAALWPLVYLPTVVGLAMSGAMLHIAARPFRRKRPQVDEVAA